MAVENCPMNVGFNRKITYKWHIFHGHVWLPEGRGYQSGGHMSRWNAEKN